MGALSARSCIAPDRWCCTRSISTGSAATASHVGETCSFDSFLDKYDLGRDPALQQLAEIVRGADISRLDLTPQSGGLFAISLGLSTIYSDDHEMLAQGMTMYDALYAWCRSCQGETHSWPPAGFASSKDASPTA